MSEEFPEAPVIWTPTPETVAGAEMTRFITWLREARGLDFADYPALWDWSTTDITGFWTAIRDFWGLKISDPTGPVLDREIMPGARWFEGARLNYADQIWRHLETRGRDAPAIRWRTEVASGTLSWGELADRAGALAASRALVQSIRRSKIVAPPPEQAATPTGCAEPEALPDARPTARKKKSAPGRRKAAWAWPALWPR